MWYCLFFGGSAILDTALGPFKISKHVQAIRRKPDIGTADPRFSISSVFHESKIPIFSYLMNTVKMLSRLALEDFSGTLDASSWDSRDYPEVGIDILPVEGARRIERRFAIWGLDQGAAIMMRNKPYHTASFTLEWSGAPVGSIEIIPWPMSSSTDLNDSQTVAQVLDYQSTTPFDNDSDARSRCFQGAHLEAIDDNQRLKIQGCLVGSAMEPFDVFVTVNAILAEVAEKGPTQRISDYVSPESDPRVQISFWTPSPAPSSPPFFEVQWLIRATALIPGFMIKKGSFAEAVFSIEVDGIQVADAHLDKRRFIMSLPSPESNISIS